MAAGDLFDLSLPMGCPFFSQMRLGGGIPVASHERVTGLLMVSTTLSSAGPSTLGGTEGKHPFSIIMLVQSPS